MPGAEAVIKQNPEALSPEVFRRRVSTLTPVAKRVQTQRDPDLAFAVQTVEGLGDPIAIGAHPLFLRMPLFQLLQDRLLLSGAIVKPLLQCRPHPRQSIVCRRSWR